MSTDAMFADMVGALKGELGEGFSTISSYVEDQGMMLAKQAQLIAESRVSGSLQDDDDLFEFFLDGLKTNTENFAKSVAMLTLLTIENAWNAIANALWGGIRSVLTGAGVPSSLLPETPPLSF